MNGAEGSQNIALVEVFDLDATNPPQLLNISTRGLVDSGVTAAATFDFCDEVCGVEVFVVVATGGMTPCRLLMALKAMMPATATT